MVDGRHASVVGELRARIAHLEQDGRARRSVRFRLEFPEIKSRLPDGGLGRGALHEVIGGGHPRDPAAIRFRCAHDPIRQAAETVVSRRRNVVQGAPSTDESGLDDKQPDDPATAAATAAPRAVTAIVDRRSTSTGLGNYRPYRNRKGENRPAPPRPGRRITQVEGAEHA